jgi:hypothetical protein
MERLTELERIGNIYAGVCYMAFFERILRTRFAWSHGPPDESLQESAFFSKRLVIQ